MVEEEIDSSSTFNVKFKGEGRTLAAACASASREMSAAIKEGRERSPLLKFRSLGCKCEIEVSVDPGWGPHDWGKETRDDFVRSAEDRVSE